MITLELTEAEAARISYAMAQEASVYNRRVHDERANGNLSAASGRFESIMTEARDECLGIIRKIEEQVG